MINFSFNKLFKSYLNGIIDLVPKKSWVAPVVASLAGSYLASEAAKDAASDQAAAADRAAQAAAFKPVDVTGLFGTGQFTNLGGGKFAAEAGLSPDARGLFDQLGRQRDMYLGQEQTPFGQLALSGGLGMLGAGLGADPFQMAQKQFGRMEDILAPGRERQREALEARLLRQGRLGSTGGSLQQQGLEEAIEQSRRKQLVNALGQAQGIQQQQIGLGTQLGLFGQQQGELGFQRAMQRLQAQQGLAYQAQEALRLGGAFGGRAAQAGAQQGAFGMQGAQYGSLANLGAAAGQAQALGKVGTALDNIDWGSGSTPYNPETGGGTLAAKTDDQWANNWDY